MMGERMAMQARLFYEFRLEEYVPAGHLLRAIDRFVDLSDLRRYLATFYSSTGRPSIDPAASPTHASARFAPANQNRRSCIAVPPPSLSAFQIRVREAT